MGYNIHWLAFLSLALIVNTVNCKVPDYVKVCKRNEDLPVCLMENFKNVVTYLTGHDEPAYKVQNFLGVHVPKMDLQATDSLRVTLTNVTFTGLDKVVIKEMSFTDSEIRMLIHNDVLNYDGQYQMNGKILILPIEGQGTMHISQMNYDIDYKAKLKIEERKGKKYYYVDNNPDDTTLSMDNVGKMIFRFDNLFGGDPRLGPEMNKFLNDNWKDVFGEVRTSLEQAGAFFVINPIVNGYLRHIPIDELFKAD